MYFRWQNKKEIVGVDPREIIPKRRDIRTIRKYRIPYLDTELLKDDRQHLKQQPPSQLPPMTAKIISNIMVSDRPFSPPSNKDYSACNYHI